MHYYPLDGYIYPHSTYMNDPWKLDIRKEKEQKWDKDELSAINRLAIILAEDLKLSPPELLSKASLIDIAIQKLENLTTIKSLTEDNMGDEITSEKVESKNTKILPFKCVYEFVDSIIKQVNVLIEMELSVNEDVEKEVGILIFKISPALRMAYELYTVCSKMPENFFDNPLQERNFVMTPNTVKPHHVILLMVSSELKNLISNQSLFCKFFSPEGYSSYSTEISNCVHLFDCYYLCKVPLLKHFVEGGTVEVSLFVHLPYEQQLTDVDYLYYDSTPSKIPQTSSNDYSWDHLPLHFAVTINDINQVIKLLNKNNDVLKPDEIGIQPMTLALYKGNKVIFSLLFLNIAKGFDANYLYRVLKAKIQLDAGLINQTQFKDVKKKLIEKYNIYEEKEVKQRLHMKQGDFSHNKTYSSLFNMNEKKVMDMKNKISEKSESKASLNLVTLLNAIEVMDSTFIDNNSNGGPNKKSKNGDSKFKLENLGDLGNLTHLNLNNLNSLNQLIGLNNSQNSSNNHINNINNSVNNNNNNINSNINNNNNNNNNNNINNGVNNVNHSSSSNLNQIVQNNPNNPNNFNNSVHLNHSVPSNFNQGVLVSSTFPNNNNSNNININFDNNMNNMNGISNSSMSSMGGSMGNSSMSSMGNINGSIGMGSMSSMSSSSMSNSMSSIGMNNSNDSSPHSFFSSMAPLSPLNSNSNNNNDFANNMNINNHNNSNNNNNESNNNNSNINSHNNNNNHNSNHNKNFSLSSPSFNDTFIKTEDFYQNSNNSNTLQVNHNIINNSNNNNNNINNNNNLNFNNNQSFFEPNNINSTNVGFNNNFNNNYTNVNNNNNGNGINNKQQQQQQQQQQYISQNQMNNFFGNSPQNPTYNNTSYNNTLYNSQVNMNNQINNNNTNMTHYTNNNNNNNNVNNNYINNNNNNNINNNNANINNSSSNLSISNNNSSANLKIKKMSNKNSSEEYKDKESFDEDEKMETNVSKKRGRPKGSTGTSNPNKKKKEKKEKPPIEVKDYFQPDDRYTIKVLFKHGRPRQFLQSPGEKIRCWQGYDVIIQVCDTKSGNVSKTISKENGHDFIIKLAAYDIKQESNSRFIECNPQNENYIEKFSSIAKEQYQKYSSKDPKGELKEPFFFAFTKNKEIHLQNGAASFTLRFWEKTKSRKVFRIRVDIPSLNIFGYSIPFRCLHKRSNKTK